MKYTKLKILSRALSNGVVGIFFEMALAFFFAFAGFVICVLWWGIIK